MKRNSILLPVAALAALTVACDDDMMEWGTPEGQTPISSSQEIPLSISEQINNYDFIKNYVAQYQSRVGSQFLIGLGLGADAYMSDAAYKAVADENFQMYTCGNAMKQGVMVKNDGSINFSTVDKFLAALPADAKVYGHNFIWHTQQNATYLKSLIAPTMVIEADGDIANMLAGDASDFEGGTTGGWGSWGGNKKSAEVVAGAGADGSYGLVLANNGDGNACDAQCAYTFDTPLSQDVTYVIKFDARCEGASGELQFQYQNGTTYSSQGAYNNFAITDKWATYQFEFTVSYDDVNSIIINFGKVGGTYHVDNIEFGEKIEDPMENILTGDDSNFDGGTKGNWGSWGNGSTTAVSEAGQGHSGDYCLVLANPSEGSDYHVAQCAYTFSDPLVEGETYILQFYAKTDLAGARVQFATQNSTSYAGEGYKDYEIGTDWTLIEHEYTCSKEGMNRILINFGKYATNFYIDDIKWGVKKAESENKATKIYYVLKTPEEKKAALDAAMESWISGMFEHIKGDNRFVAWDVINEAIADGGGRRGINGVFGGSWTEDDVTYYDQEPVETEAEGLSLNWSAATGNQHFYWGYYMGMDYAINAFKYARKYADENGLADLKLFYNDYNLETNPDKVKDVVEFVRDIDAGAGAPVVDGIGTQMHVTAATSASAAEQQRAQFDEMFKALAATGKLVRVTELDVAIGSSAPSAAQQEWQAKCYQNVFESYIENVPEAQRSGITIWTLSDAAEEHEYWLNGDAPNLFDANLARKWAYKGVCDGIAGSDLGTSFSGDAWKDKNYQDRSEKEAEAEEAENAEDAAE